MKYASFLIKPASSLCNMRCTYCFYADEAANRSEASLGIMSRDTVDELIRSAFEYTDAGGHISFAFQGGEPTMAGLDFFKYFTEAVKNYPKKGITVHYSIQTNGINLNADWMSFFKENDFLIGISLDGDKALHDAQRKDSAGKGTWNRVTKSVAMALKYGVETNLLCVVTRNCAKSAVRVYHALQKTGVEYLQFIACLDPLGDVRGAQPYSLTPDDYGNFLCDLFDAWYLDWKNGRYTSVRLFDDYVHLAMGLPAGTCATSGSCGNSLIIEADGSVYPCDFYVLDEWRLGCLGDAPLSEMAQGETELAFLKESLDHPAACADCQWKNMCNGGCRRDWDTDTIKGGKYNYFCPAFKKFFSYAMPRIEEIARCEMLVRR